jgi:hypothetical protein
MAGDRPITEVRTPNVRICPAVFSEDQGKFEF